MAHTQIWDSSYENIPADNDQASEGALRIRNLKRDIRERAEIDHDWDDVTDAGKHLQVSFRDPLAAKPTAAASEGYLYTKDVSAKAELFYEDEDGNELQLSAAGVIPETSLAYFPSATIMLFGGAAAPIGWTKGATHDNKALRLVTGTPSTGGSVAFTTAFHATRTTTGVAISAAQMPAHVHTITHTHTTPAHSHVQKVSGGFGGAENNKPENADSRTAALNNSVSTAVDGGGTTGASSAANTGSIGSGTTHAHTSNLAVQFVDVILATKD